MPYHCRSSGVACGERKLYSVRLGRQAQNTGDLARNSQAAPSLIAAHWKGVRSYPSSDFTHQESRRLVAAYDFMAVEVLSVRAMVQNQTLAKSIHDAAWTQFAAPLAYEAAWAGRRCVVVDPRHTSQTCSGCGWRNPDLTLADRVFHCLNPARLYCRLVLNRDRNAAINILARGRELLALG